MADFDWITEDLGRIKNELRLARNTASCRKIYDCMNISPELMDTTDLTLAFRRAFGVFLDPSIRVEFYSKVGGYSLPRQAER